MFRCRFAATIVSFILIAVCIVGIVDTNRDLRETKEWNEQLTATPAPTTFAQNAWFPVRKGDIQCVYTNYTIFNVSDGTRPVAVWGRTLPWQGKMNNSDTWCSTSDVLRYVELLQFRCNCPVEKIKAELEKDYPLNVSFDCSVNQQCTFLRPFFVPQPPTPPDPKDIAHLEFGIAALVIIVGCFLASFIYCGILTKREYDRERIARLHLLIDGAPTNNEL